MKHLLAAAAIMAAVTGPAIADDPACGDANYLLTNVNDILHTIELVNSGSRGPRSIAMDAEDLAYYGDDAMERTKDEGWPADYRETLGKLMALGTDIAGRGGELAEGDAATIRSYGMALRSATAERCDADDIPVFIEPGGLACKYVVESLELLAEHPSALSGGEPLFLFQVADGVRKAANSVRGQHWSAETVAAMDRASAISSDLSRAVTEPSADAAAEIVALSTTMAAEAQTICPTETIPKISAGS
jgi:hypothetical protein